MTKEKKAAYNKTYNESHREERRVRDKVYYKSHKEKLIARQKRYYEAHTEKILITQKAYKIAHKDEIAAITKAYDTALKKAAFEAYGGCECKWCGEVDFQLLCLDHVNNDGSKHRKETGKGTSFYRWLKTHNYPSGLQVLCWNCNMAKQFNGGVLPENRKDKLRQKSEEAMAWQMA